MKKFVEPKLVVGSEFVLHNRVCVVDKIFDEHDTYHGHPYTKTKVVFYWKTSDPASRTNWTVTLDDLYQEMYESSDEFLSSKIEDRLEDIEDGVNSLNEISSEGKAELLELISKMRKKLEEL